MICFNEVSFEVQAAAVFTAVSVRCLLKTYTEAMENIPSLYDWNRIMVISLGAKTYMLEMNV
jgi:hypothetical protein